MTTLSNNYCKASRVFQFEMKAISVEFVSHLFNYDWTIDYSIKNESRNMIVNWVQFWSHIWRHQCALLICKSKQCGQQKQGYWLVLWQLNWRQIWSIGWRTWQATWKNKTTDIVLIFLVQDWLQIRNVYIKSKERVFDVNVEKWHTNHCKLQLNSPVSN